MVSRLSNAMVVFLLLIMISLNYSCKKESLPEFCQASCAAKSWFAEDAFSLACHTIYLDTTSSYHHYKDSLFIPRDLVNRIEKQLATIYDRAEGLERDTIIDYRIHAIKFFERGRIYFRLLKESPWAQQLANGEEITANHRVKCLFDQYGIRDASVTSHPVIPKYYRVRAKVNSFVNVIQLDQVLTENDGFYQVRAAIGGPPNGNHYNIFLEQQGEVSIFEFQPFMGTHNWRFAVAEDCSATFVGY